VTIALPAGYVTSSVSQADADSNAQASANQQAQAALVCSYTNDTIIVTCPLGGSITIAEGAYTSPYSKDLANQAATAAANLKCAQSSGGTVYYNTAQQGSASFYCSPKRCGPALCNPSPGSAQGTTVTAEANVPAGQFSSTVSQADANDQALQYANQLAQAAAEQKCNS